MSLNWLSPFWLLSNVNWQSYNPHWSDRSWVIYCSSSECKLFVACRHEEVADIRCFFAGGVRFAEQTIKSTAAQLNASLLLIAVIAVLIPSAFHFSITTSENGDGMSSVALFNCILTSRSHFDRCRGRKRLVGDVPRSRCPLVGTIHRILDFPNVVACRKLFIHKRIIMIWWKGSLHGWRNFIVHSLSPRTKGSSKREIEYQAKDQI